jgi:hypothetical protein
MSDESNKLSYDVSEMLEVYDEQIQKDISSFAMLIDTITTAEERKKELWKKIHYNAVIDRRNAFMMYADLVKQIEKDHTQHAVLGTHVAKYLERMSKSNEQLIKLAEIVDSKVTAIESTVTSNDSILDLIQTNQNKKNKK